MAAKFELKTTKSCKFMFNLKAPNGQVILTSEMYESLAAAKNGIQSVKNNSKKEANFERKKGKNGQPFFVLKATNKEVIGRSEMYSSLSSVAKGIASIMRNAGSARIVQL
jgi:uncharacterized protein